MIDKQSRKTDRVSSSQFLMIVMVVGIMLVVLAVWHPWVTRTVNGVPNSDVSTARP